MEDKNPNPEHTSSGEPSTKQEPSWFFSKLGPTLLLVLSSLFGGGVGAIIGDEYDLPITRTLITRQQEQEQEIRNTEDSLRSILRRVKDKQISIQSAILEILKTFIQYNVPPTRELIDKITEIIREVINTGTEIAVEEGLKKLLELLIQGTVSSTKPTPTATPSPSPSVIVR